MTTEQFPRNQHVVSRVVLRAFERRGLVVRRDLKRGREEEKSTKVVARQRDFVRPEFARPIENRWSKTETRVPEATHAVLDGTIFDRPDLVKVLHETIALHLVRSTAYREIHQAQVRVLLEQDRMALHRTAPDLLDRWYEERYGLVSTGPGARDLLIDDLYAGFVDASESGELFAERLGELYDSILPWVVIRGLEVGIAPAGHEFLIGDIPALTLDYTEMRAGLHNGVALLDADTVVFPLHPRRILALGPENASRVLSPRSVKELNAAQIGSAHEHVFFRPGSGLGALAERLRPPEANSNVAR